MQNLTKRGVKITWERNLPKSSPNKIMSLTNVPNLFRSSIMLLRETFWCTKFININVGGISHQMQEKKSPQY